MPVLCACQCMRGGALVEQLHAVHAAVARAGLGIVRDDDGQRDEGPAVVGPAGHDRQLRQIDVDLSTTSWQGAAPLIDLGSAPTTRAELGQHLELVPQRARRRGAAAARPARARAPRCRARRAPSPCARREPKTLMASGKREPRGFSNRSAGPPPGIFMVRSAISAISSRGSHSRRMRTSSPAPSSVSMNARSEGNIRPPVRTARARCSAAPRTMASAAADRAPTRPRAVSCRASLARGFGAAGARRPRRRRRRRHRHRRRRRRRARARNERLALERVQAQAVSACLRAHLTEPILPSASRIALDVEHVVDDLKGAAEMQPVGAERVGDRRLAAGQPRAGAPAPGEQRRGLAVDDRRCSRRRRDRRARDAAAAAPRRRSCGRWRPADRRARRRRRVAAVSSSARMSRKSPPSTDAALPHKTRAAGQPAPRAPVVEHVVVQAASRRAPARPPAPAWSPSARVARTSTGTPTARAASITKSGRTRLPPARRSGAPRARPGRDRRRPAPAARSPRRRRCRRRAA